MTIVYEVLAGLIALLTTITGGTPAEPTEPTTVVAEAASVPTAEAVSSRSEVASVEVQPEQVLTPITRQEAIDQGGGAIDTALEPEQVLTCVHPASSRPEQLIVADNGDGLALPDDVELVGIVGPGRDEGTVVVDVIRNVAETTSTHTAASLDLSGGIPEGCTLDVYPS